MSVGYLIQTSSPVTLEISLSICMQWRAVYSAGDCVHVELVLTFVLSVNGYTML